MHERMGAVHAQMGQMMEGMTSDEMQSLCRTTRESMRAAMRGDPPDEFNAAPVDDPSRDEKTSRWLQGARGFEGFMDRTGRDEVERGPVLDVCLLDPLLCKTGLEVVEPRRSAFGDSTPSP